MWVRQCDLDAETDFLPPIPSRIASNEEFVPPPQSAEQKEYEDRLAQISERDRPAAGPLAARLPPQRQRHGRRAAGPQPGLRRLLRGRRRGGRGPQGVRGEMAQGPVRLRRADPPRRRQPQVVRRHARPAAASRAFFRMLRPEAKSDGARDGAAEPGPLRQGGLRRQRHGHGGHQRRPQPRLGQEPAARPTRWSPPASSSTTWPARGACSRTACCGPTSASPSSRRWSARSRT